MVTVLAQFSFHLFTPGYVPPDRLKFNQSTLVVEESPVGPLLPAYRSLTIYRQMFKRINWFIDAIRGKCGTDNRMILFGNEFKNAGAQEFFRFLPKKVRISTIDKGQVAIGRRTTNQFGLILHNGPVAGF